MDILWFEGDYPYLEQTFDLPRTVRIFALQDGMWKLLDTTLEGELKFSDLNKFSFPPVKTTAIKMVVENHPGKSSRAFSAWFTEEVTAGYFLRCRRENNTLHLLVNDTYFGALSGNWRKSRVGLFTGGQKAVFNGMIFYELPEN